MEWELTVVYNKDTYVFKWEEQFFGGKSLGFYPTVYSTVNSTLVDVLSTNVPDENKRIGKAVQAAATAFRKEELGLYDFTGEIISGFGSQLEQKIMDIYVRVTNSEFVGQHNAGVIYLQEVANLLNITILAVNKTVGTLIEDKKIGLSGAILVPYESYAKTKTKYFEETGHKNLSVSDWGFWICQECLNSGDDYELPADTPCVKKVDDIKRITKDG